MQKMKSLKICLLVLVWACYLPTWLVALPEGELAGKKYTVSGSIRDQETGEELLGASVFIRELNTGTVSNVYGFYSISLPPGKYTLVFSYVGYATESQAVQLDKDISLTIRLTASAALLKEVEIKGKREDIHVRSTEMSVVRMDVKSIRQIPALMGEVDVLKAIQLLPGVQATTEGGSGFSVRGGNPDQNLILLDEATVYNASHLLGFFSVFNNDAVKDVTLYKGDIPPSAGGRLSSLLDIRMKDGNAGRTAATGGVGTISSRLTLEGPLHQDKITYLLAGRRTYADIFLRFANREEIRDNILYFYDLNGKLNFRIDEKNRLFFSSYYGKDVFRNDDFKMGWGNQTLSLRWNHLFSNKLFSNFTLVHSTYRYNLGIPEGEANSFDWAAKMQDNGLKADFGYYPNPRHTIKFGLSVIHHRIFPGTARGLGNETLFNELTLPHQESLESGVYTGNEQKLGSRLTVKYGLRFSLFQNLGPATVFSYDPQYLPADSTVYSKRKPYNHYKALEPRAGLTYLLREDMSLKANYVRTVQYIHLATNSTAGTPLDIWFPSSPRVKPQRADQFTLGLFRNFSRNTIEASVEVYYKKTENAIDFKDYAELLLNKHLEGELRFGEAEAYGLEWLIRKQEGRLNGWVGYTLSRTVRKIPEINKGKAYLSPYDKTHDVSVVVNYDLSPRISLGGTWVYATGNPVTFPTGRAYIGNKIVPIFSDRNSYRLPDYHRLDLSVTWRGKEKPGRSFRGEWNLSVYNAYARKNAWVINFVQEEDNPDVTYAEMTYLFSIIPSLTYNFKF